MPRGNNTFGFNYMPRHVQGVGLVDLGDYESKKAHLLLTTYFATDQNEAQFGSFSVRCF